MRLSALLVLMLLVPLAADVAGARSVKAYFDGQEATVTGVVLRVGEPFKVNLTVTPDAESDVYVMLVEPGVDAAYDRIDGEAKGAPVSRHCGAGSSVSFGWTLAANGRWTDGNAPVNVYYQIDACDRSVPEVSGLFTVVDAYIPPGEPAASPADSPGPAMTPSAAGAGAVEAAICLAICALASSCKK